MINNRSSQKSISRAEPLQIVPALTARKLFLGAQGLLAKTNQPCTGTSLYKLIAALGFVQLDSISVVERAHHHILATRMQSYQPAVLDKLQRTGKLFEHFTHDASLIPATWFPHWRHRFARAGGSAWLQSKLGPQSKTVLRTVLIAVCKSRERYNSFCKPL